MAVMCGSTTVVLCCIEILIFLPHPHVRVESRATPVGQAIATRTEPLSHHQLLVRPATLCTMHGGPDHPVRGRKNVTAESRHDYNRYLSLIHGATSWLVCYHTQTVQ